MWLFEWAHIHGSYCKSTLRDYTPLTNNVIQCERDGLEIVHIEILNEGKRPFMQYAIKAQINFTHYPFKKLTPVGD